MNNAHRTFSGLHRSLATLRSSPGFATYASGRYETNIHPSLLNIGCGFIESICVQKRHVKINEEIFLTLCHELISHWATEQSDISPEFMIDALNQEGLLSGIYAELAIPVISSCLINAIFEELLAGEPTRPEGSVKMNLTVLQRLTILNSDALIELSPVDQLLRQDPSGIVSAMDPYSICQLRRAVYSIADKWHISEIEVAAAALAIASRVTGGRGSSVRAHVGYFLTEEAHRELATELNCHIGSVDLERRGAALAKKHSIASCLGISAMLIGLIGSSLSSMVTFQVVLLVAILADACAIIYEQALANRIPERQLPSLDFVSEGIPSEHAAAIVVPCLLSSEENLAKVLLLLEKNFLRANDSSVSVCLLTDFVDSLEQHPNAAETALLASAKAAIIALNAKYAKWSTNAFVLLHRDREFCHGEGVWMGLERKRGKLNALNDLVMRKVNGFSTHAGGIDRLFGIKYVLLMDEDCVLDVNSLQLLVGTMAHPLVAPVLSRDGSSLERGHAILVPHLATDKMQLGAWSNSYLVTGPQEQIDISHTIMRNVTFDVFGAVHYPGKGLYHVATFDRLCRHRIPDRRILSHDTVEAIWTRPGFVCRARILEGFPNHIDSLTMRRHRWVRGDLQNLVFALSLTMRGLTREKLPLVSWHVLRLQIRSAWTPTLIALQVVLVLFDPSTLRSGIFLSALIFVLSLPPFVYFGNAVAAHGLLSPQLLYTAWTCLKDGIKIATYRVGTSLYQAALTIDAYTRTFYRLFRQRNLMDWTSASLVDSHIARQRALVERYAMTSVAIAFVFLVYGVITRTLTVPSLAVLVCWICVPAFRGVVFSKSRQWTMTPWIPKKHV